MATAEYEEPSGRWKRLMQRFPRGTRILVDGEADRLERRISEKVERNLLLTRLDSPAGDVAGELEPFHDWLHLRFREPLEHDARAGPSFGKAATAIGVATIGAGLASSALATTTGNGATELVAVLGIGVGVLTAINQIWRPSQRSVARYQAAYALRREGWDFLQDRGRYERLESSQRLGAFIDEVSRIHRGVESVDEAASPAQAGG